jgi:hypothetical protein
VTVIKTKNVKHCVGGLTQVQEGQLGENEFWKLVVLQTNGRIEPRRPLPDDERIDFVIHAPGGIDPILAVQVKTTFRTRRAGRANRLFIHFDAPRNGLLTHPRYWYFLNHFDRPRMSVSNPVFFAPSTFVHRLAVPISANRVRFYLEASLDIRSKDRWAKYRTPVDDLGHRIEETLGGVVTESLTQQAKWHGVFRGGVTIRGHPKAA